MTKVPNVPKAHTSTLAHFRSLHTLGTSGIMLLKAQFILSDLAPTGCVAIGRTALIGTFVIPGLTRNPAVFLRLALLDAGSSPA